MNDKSKNRNSRILALNAIEISDERKEELIENGKIDSPIGDQLYDQLQPAMQQYKQQATSLHELAISVLGLAPANLPQDIDKLEKKQKDIALIQKTQQEIDQDKSK